MGCSRGVPGLFQAVPGCSGGVPGVFRGVPGCSGCVPGFTDTPGKCFTRTLVLIHACDYCTEPNTASPRALTSGFYRMSILGNDTTMVHPKTNLPRNLRLHADYEAIL